MRIRTGGSDVSPAEPEPEPTPTPAVELIEGPTGILLVTPEGTVSASWDLWTGDGVDRISTLHSVGEVIAVDPGTYRAKEYANAGFEWGELAVEDGMTTPLTLGAIEVVAPDQAAGGSWDLWDASGENRFDSLNDNGNVVPVLPGTFTVKEYANAGYTWASDVNVERGEVTEIQLGAPVPAPGTFGTQRTKAESTR